MASKGNLGEFEQLVLLAVLQCGHGAFGLEIRRELETRAARTVTRGAFYTTLDRLEGKGLLRWTEEAPPDGRMSKPLRRYEVTGEGLVALRSALDAVEALRSGLDRVLGGA
jgi:DNA-binding PadR family transcriptional regulator